MKIYSDDGELFNSIDECNSYEKDLALKKKKEQEEKEKAIAKAEAERKIMEDTKKNRYNRVMECVELVRKAARLYNEVTDSKFTHISIYIDEK